MWGCGEDTGQTLRAGKEREQMGILSPAAWKHNTLASELALRMKSLA